MSAKLVCYIGNFGYFFGFCFFRMAAVIQCALWQGVDGKVSIPAYVLMLGALFQCPHNAAVAH